MSTEKKEDKTPWTAPLGAPCWIELMSADPLKLKEFYAAIFPAWKFRAIDIKSSSDIIHIEFEQPSGLSGGIIKLPEGCPKPDDQPMCIGSTVYYFVDSIDEIDKKIVGLGGKKVLDKKPEGDNGWYANFKDPEGHRFGVYETRMKK